MIKGEAELQKVLSGLPGQLEKELKKANKKASELVVNKMHRLAPVGLTGNLADSIGTIVEKGNVIIGPRRKGGYKGFAGHLVEFGTKKRKTKSGANKGVMPKDPFVEPAWDQTKDEVLGRISKELEKATVKYARGIL